MSNIENHIKIELGKLEKDLDQKSISANEVTEGDLVEKLKQRMNKSVNSLDEGNKCQEGGVQLNQLDKEVKTTKLN